LTSEVDRFMDLPLDTTVVNLHQNQSIHFQNIVFTSLVTDGQVENIMSVNHLNILMLQSRQYSNT